MVQLSSATNSTSEMLAATPKSVKAAYDLANG
ncbi:phage tail protein, partial [Escherichia coli]